MMKKICLAFLLLLSGLTDSRTVTRNKVLIISFDGFRWDYPKKFDTPNLEYVARNGVHAPEGITTAFVSKTFPTHHSISTGLYPESHGIVDSNMFDPLLNKTFRMFEKEAKNPEWWSDGEPIWITARKNGLKSGVFFWPGSDVRIQGMFPTYHRRYNNKISFETRVDGVIDWLSKNDVDIAMVYFNEPDHTGHNFGTNSPEMERMVERVDGILGLTMKRLRDVGLFDKVNILIVSDHGMIDFTDQDSPFIRLKDYIHMKRDVQMALGFGPVATIIPRPGKLNEVYQKLKGAHPHMKVYLKENMPERFHYKNHRRIHDIILIADPGYDISVNRKSSDLAANHGYDNRHWSMKPIFYARGPDFKVGYEAPNFESVDIYPMVCHLLGIPPAPNNGSLSRVADLLKNPPSSVPSSTRLLSRSNPSLAEEFPEETQYELPGYHDSSIYDPEESGLWTGA